MRRFTLALALLLGIAAQAQIRTSSDSANGNFVIGLDNYLRFTVSSAGTAGFDFSTHGQVFKAIVVGQSVEISQVGGAQTAIYSDGRYRLSPARPSLSIPALGVNDTGRFLDTNEIVVGVHDFTNDREPELVVALRDISGKLRILCVRAEEIQIDVDRSLSERGARESQRQHDHEFLEHLPISLFEVW